MSKNTLRKILVFTIFLTMFTAYSAYALGSLFKSDEDAGEFREQEQSSHEQAFEIETEPDTGAAHTLSHPDDSSPENILHKGSGHVVIPGGGEAESSRLDENVLSRGLWRIPVELSDEEKSFFHINEFGIDTIKDYDYLLSLAPSVNRIGIYIEDMRTGKVFSIHPYEDFYAASTRKLAIATIALDLVKEGKFRLEDYVSYHPDWDDEPGSSVIQVYGKKGDAYPVRTLIEYIGKYSDNIALNMLVRKITATVGYEEYKLRMTSILHRDFNSDNLYSPAQLSESVKYLCRSHLNGPPYEVLIHALEECTYNEYATKNMPKGSYFHKNGLYYGEEKNYANDIGVVYGEHPLIYSIMIEWKGNESEFPYPLLHQLSRYLRYIATTGDFPELEPAIQEKVYGD